MDTQCKDVVLMTFMVFEHGRLIDEFLGKDVILSGRTSMFLRGHITLANFPIEYYGDEYPYLDFLVCLGPKEGVEYVEIRGRKHATQDRAIGDLINGYIRGEATMQEFEETFLEDRIEDIGIGFRDYVKDKEKMKELFEMWGMDEYGKRK